MRDDRPGCLCYRRRLRSLPFDAAAAPTPFISTPPLRAGNIKHALHLHPNDTHIIYPLGSTVVIKNVEDASDQVFLQGHTDRVMCIALTRDGKTMATGQITHMGYLAEIILWDVSCLWDLSAKHGESGAPKLLKRLRLHKVQVQALDFSFDGKYLASVGGPDDNNLVIWNVENGKAICGSPAAHDTALTVKWMNTSNTSLVTGGIKQLRIWELDPIARKLKPAPVATQKEVRTYTTIAIAGDDKTIFAGTTTGDVLVIASDRQQMLKQGPLKDKMLGCGVTAMCLNGDQLLVGSGDGEIMTLDLSTPASRRSACRRSSAR